MDADGWDARYAGAELLWTPRPNPWVREIFGALNPGRAIDIAAGEGRNAYWLLHQGWTVVATDFSPVAVEKMRRLATDRLSVEEQLRFEARVEDATLPVPDRPYDAALLCQVHLPEEQWRVALSQAVEGVSRGGVVVVVQHSLRNHREGHGGPSKADLCRDPEALIASAAGLPVAVERAEMREREALGDDGAVLGPAYDSVVVWRRTP